MFLCDTTMVLGDPYWQLHAVLSIFPRKTLIFKVKRKNRASKSRKCHGSDLESHQYDEMSPGSPIGHFYGLNWSTGRSPSEWLPSICAKTRGSLKRIEFIASFWEGRGSPQLEEIKSGNQPTGSIFAGCERSWLGLVSLWKDWGLDRGVSRFLVHKSVTFSVYWLGSKFIRSGLNHP